MAIKIKRDQVYLIRDPAHFYDEILKDLNLLWDAGSFSSAVTLMVCFIDAFAGGNKRDFVPFMERQFPALCTELHALRPQKSGAITFYDEYRNGMAHLRGPRSGYALARDSETQGKQAAEFEIEGDNARYIGISVDRLHTDFLALVERIRPKP